MKKNIYKWFALPTLYVCSGVLGRYLTKKGYAEFVEAWTAPGKAVALGENALEVRGEFPFGGTKAVYDVLLQGQPYALALPHLDAVHPEELLRRWAIALQEPEHTSFLRENGCYVNEIMDARLVRAKDAYFPGLFMKRFQDHDYAIFDAKNRRSSHELFKVAEGLSDELAADKLAPMTGDIRRLLNMGVHLGRDSFNLCLVDGLPHVYLNDLAHASFSPFSPTERVDYAQTYVAAAIGAVLETVSMRVYMSNPYVHALGDVGRTLDAVLVDQVLAARD